VLLAARHVFAASEAQVPLCMAASTAPTPSDCTYASAMKPARSSAHGVVASGGRAGGGGGVVGGGLGGGSVHSHEAEDERTRMYAIASTASVVPACAPSKGPQSIS